MSYSLLLYLTCLFAYIVSYSKGKVHLTSARTLIACLIITIVTGIISVVPLITENVPQSGYCLPLYFWINQRESIWYFNISVFISLSSLLSMVQIGCSLKSAFVMQSSAQRVRMQGSISGGKDTKGKILVSFIPLISNLVFMIPIQAILLTVLSGKRLNYFVIDCFIISFLPLSSLINPYLYTIRLMVSKARKSRKERQ